MVNEILTALDIPFKETRFLSPPTGSSYAVYNDDREARGSDDKNRLIVHDISVEIYEYAPDKPTEESLEQILDSRGIEYVKQSRYWLQDEQLYQVVYDFSYITKI